MTRSTKKSSTNFFFSLDIFQFQIFQNGFIRLRSSILILIFMTCLFLKLFISSFDWIGNFYQCCRESHQSGLVMLYMDEKEIIRDTVEKQKRETVKHN